MSMGGGILSDDPDEGLVGVLFFNGVGFLRVALAGGPQDHWRRRGEDMGAGGSFGGKKNDRAKGI